MGRPCNKVRERLIEEYLIYYDLTKNSKTASASISSDVLRNVIFPFISRSYEKTKRKKTLEDFRQSLSLKPTTSPGFIHTVFNLAKKAFRLLANLFVETDVASLLHEIDNTNQNRHDNTVSKNKAYHEIEQKGLVQQPTLDDYLPSHSILHDFRHSQEFSPRLKSVHPKEIMEPYGNDSSSIKLNKPKF